MCLMFTEQNETGLLQSPVYIWFVLAISSLTSLHTTRDMYDWYWAIGVEEINKINSRLTCNRGAYLNNTTQETYLNFL